jgi:hypothetical protein
MGDLAAYYRELAEWEEKPVVDLTAPWEKPHIQAIVDYFRVAFRMCNFNATSLAVPENLSNQAVGNRVAEFFVRFINRHLKAHAIDDCSGAGYPDKRLRGLAASSAFVFELKATSEFDPNDSNRIVLTSSAEKLRRHFRPPINHLLAAICYRQDGTQIRIQNLRLDFLEPTTPVNVRLEASVSQRILARAAHPNFAF